MAKCKLTCTVFVPLKYSPLLSCHFGKMDKQVNLNVVKGEEKMDM